MLREVLPLGHFLYCLVRIACFSLVIHFSAKNWYADAKSPEWAESASFARECTHTASHAHTQMMLTHLQAQLQVLLQIFSELSSVDSLEVSGHNSLCARSYEGSTTGCTTPPVGAKKNVPGLTLASMGEYPTGESTPTATADEPAERRVSLGGRVMGGVSVVTTPCEGHVATSSLITVELSLPEADVAQSEDTPAPSPPMMNLHNHREHHHRQHSTGCGTRGKNTRRPPASPSCPRAWIPDGGHIVVQHAGENVVIDTAFGEFLRTIYGNVAICAGARTGV